MRKFGYTMLGLFIVLFLMGYLPLRSIDKEKQKIVCTKIFSFPLWSLATIFNGVGNACLDVGILP